MASIISTQTITFGSGANPAAVNITPPSGCNQVVVLPGYFAPTNGAGLAAMTLNGNAPNQTFEVPIVSASFESYVGAIRFDNPPIGSPIPLDPQWDAAPSDGPTCTVVFVQNANTGVAWRDVDGSNTTGSTANSVTLTGLTAGDLVLKLDLRFNATAPGDSAGWTPVTTQVNVNSLSTTLNSIVATGATQVCNSENEDFSSLVALAIVDGGGGGAAINANADALAITEQVAAVSLGLNIAAALDTLTITEPAALVGIGRVILAGFDQLRISRIPTGSIDLPGGSSATNDGCLRITRPNSLGSAFMAYGCRIKMAPGSNTHTGVTEDASYASNATEGPILVDDDNTLGNGLICGVTGGRPYLAVNIGGSGRTRIATTDLRDNQWHHVEYRYNASTGLMQILVDGVVEDEFTGPAGSIAHNGHPTSANGGIYWGIEKLEVTFGTKCRIVNPYILTSELWGLSGSGASYTVPSGPVEPQSGVLATYYLSEGSGTTVGDSSGNGFNGALQGDGGLPTWNTDSPFGPGLRAVVQLSRNVSAAVDALVLTERVATVDVDGGTDIAAALAQIVITERLAGVQLSRNIAAAVDTLQITERSAAITLSRNIAANVDTILVTELAAAVTSGLQISALTDALAIVERTANVNRGNAIAAQFDQLTISEQLAVAKLSRNVQASIDQLVLTEGTAAVSLGKAIMAAVDALTIAEQQGLVNGTPAIIQIVASRIVRAAARQSTVRAGARNSTVH